MPFDYLIGASRETVAGAMAAGHRVMVPFDYDGALRPQDVKYGNLFDENYDEDNHTGEFPPYLTATDVSDEYGEGVIDPSGDGFMRNIRAQVDRCVAQGGTAIEWDNADAKPYGVEHALRAFNEAAARGLKSIAKNPLLVEGGAQLVAHPSCQAAIVEQGSGSPAEMDKLRRDAGRPDLFVQFVFERGASQPAEICAGAARQYRNMAVSWSIGRYSDVHHVLTADETSQTVPAQRPVMAKPAHLTLANSLIEKYEDGPDVPKLAMEVAGAFPDMTSYCRLATISTSWCGIFIAVMLLRSYGTRPPFGSTDVLRFMWVDAWEDEQWGAQSIPISQAQPGDIVIMRSPHHISILDEVDGDTFWCIGGNQSNTVTRAPFSRSGVRSIRRAPAVQVLAQPSAPARPAVSNFDKCIVLTLKEEGGNDDDPRDPGGRTSRGITAERWSEWRATHPGLPSDVWDAPQDQVLAIYREKYWNAMRCDDLPAGVDLAVFDFGVNSGPARSATFLQRIVIPSEVDGEIGPNTIGATARVDARTLAAEICDDRLAFLQGLSTWSTFGNGWGARVRRIRAAALEMAATPKATGPTPMPKASPEVEVLPPPAKPDDLLKNIWTQLRPQLEPIIQQALASVVQEVLTQILTKHGLPLALPAPATPAPAAPPPAQPAPATPALQRPSMQIGGLASVATIFAQVLGALPPSVGSNATTAGILTTLAPLAVTALAPTGVWGTLLKGVVGAFSAMRNASK